MDSANEREVVTTSDTDWNVELHRLEQGFLAIAERRVSGVVVSRLVGSVEATEELAVLALRPLYEKYRSMHPRASPTPPWEP